MNSLRLFIIPLLAVTFALYAGSTFLRRDSQFDLADKNHSKLETVEQLTRSSLDHFGAIYSFSSSLVASVNSTAEAYSSFFSVGLEELQHSLLEINRIEFENVYYLKPASLLRVTKFEETPNVLSLSIEDRLNLLRRHPWVEDVSIDFNVLPIRLKIDIKEAEPWVVVEYSGHSWLLSRKRKLLSPLAVLPNRDLIELSSSKGRIDGLADIPGVENYLSSENARLEYATKMVALLEMANVFEQDIDRYTLRKDGSLLVSARPPSPAPNVRLNVHTLEQAELAATQLRTVLVDLAKRGEKAREIDLRFQPQVIVR